MVALRLATPWLVLLALAVVPEARAGSGGVVVVDGLSFFDEPEDTAYASGILRRGTRVTVVPGGKGGWLAIEPPDDAFDWILQDAINEADDGRAEVVVESAPIRSGAPGARMPGPPRPSLPQGSIVVLVDRPSLTLAR